MLKFDKTLVANVKVKIMLNKPKLEFFLTHLTKYGVSVSNWAFFLCLLYCCRLAFSKVKSWWSITLRLGDSPFPLQEKDRFLITVRIWQILEKNRSAYFGNMAIPVDNASLGNWGGCRNYNLSSPMEPKKDNFSKQEKHHSKKKKRKKKKQKRRRKRH